MHKWLFIFLSIAIISLTIGVTLENYSSSEMAKTGLEQCPTRGAGSVSASIWVKSCSEYSAAIRNK